MTPKPRHVIDCHDMTLRGDVIQLRISAEEKAQWKAAARASGATLTQWIRQRCRGTVTDGPPPARPDNMTELQVARRKALSAPVNLENLKK